MATYDKDFLLSLYRNMVRIRAFEEHAAECFTKGMLAGNIHLSIGQEAAEAGAFAAIEPKDYFTSTHRGHGHAIARGADPKLAMAELFGKATGYCKGKGGSMHIADMKKMNHLGANGIVGAGQPISAGSALASKIMEDGSVTVGCFGDGATNEGSFHESLNRAGGALLFDAPPASRPPGLYPSCGLKRLGWTVCSGPDSGGAGRHRASPTPVSRGKGFPVSAFGSPSRASLQLCAELTKFLSALRSEEVPPEPPASHRIRWQELRPSGHILLSRLF